MLTQSAHAPAMDAIDAAMHQLARIERGAKFHIQRGVFHDLRRTAATGLQKLNVQLQVPRQFWTM